MESSFDKSSDRSNLYQKIIDFPKQFKVGLQETQKIGKINFRTPVSNIIFCGMGGSAIPGELFQTLNNQLKLTDLSVFLRRNYGLPPQANKDSLIVCDSYSGNTEETLSCFNEALEKKLKILSLGSGGELFELSKKHNIPFAKMPAGYPPRSAIGFTFSAVLKLLSLAGIIEEQDEKLLELEEILEPQKIEPFGQELAESLLGKIPLIYTSDKWWSLGKIWKVNFNESAEIPCFFSILPELNHHEMVGFTDHGPYSNHSNFRLLILKNTTEGERILKRMWLTAEILRENGVLSQVIKINGRNSFEKMFSNILLSYWTSYFLALRYHVDPSTQDITEEFKRRMEQG